jgi:KDO2-lipid IV(A) lauroyltransferase
MVKISLKTFFHPKYWYAWPVLALLVLSSWMPIWVLWFLGSALGWFFSWFPSPACRVAAKNIELCFPELTPSERRKLVNRHFRCCGVAVLSLGVTFFAPLWRIRQIVRVRDEHNFDAARASGRNIILLAPHFITLDIGGMRAGYDKNLVCMYRKARNPLVEYLFQRRTRSGAVLVDRLASLKPLLRHIRDGRPFYYLPDQDMGVRASVFVPFFGIPAATVTALSRIAETTNAAVVPCVSRILPNGKGFEVRFYPALENFPGKDPVEDAQRMNQEIEKWVREMPEQYMWSYRRFKTRPNNEPSLYSKK